MNQIENIMAESSQFLLKNAILPGSGPKLRTWITVANTSTIRIFEEKSGELKIVDRILLPPDESRAKFCLAEYGNKSLLQYNPGVYIPDNKNEPVNFAHKFTAGMDEALWNDKFDQMILIADCALIGVLFQALSRPLQARTMALINPDLVWMETDTLEKEIPDAIRLCLHYSYKGNSHEKY